jgi:hypothetical protein
VQDTLAFLALYFVKRLAPDGLRGDPDEAGNERWKGGGRDFADRALINTERRPDLGNEIWRRIFESKGKGIGSSQHMHRSSLQAKSKGTPSLTKRYRTFLILERSMFAERERVGNVVMVLAVLPGPAETDVGMLNDSPVNPPVRRSKCRSAMFLRH